MMNRIILCILALLIIVPLTTAATTPIKINTERLADVRVFVMEPGAITALESFHQDSGVTGKLAFVSEASAPEIQILITIKRNDNILASEKLGPYKTGTAIEITIPKDLVAPVEPVTEEIAADANQVEEQDNPETNTEQTEENTQDDQNIENTIDNTLTGSVVAESTGSNSGLMKTIYYSIGGVLLVGIVLFFIITVAARGRKVPQYGMRPMKLKGPPPKTNYEDEGEELTKIEKEISTVEKEINHYKNRNRLEDAERKLEEKKKYLEQLKGPQNSQPNAKPSTIAGPDKPQFPDARQQKDNFKFRKFD